MSTQLEADVRDETSQRYDSILVPLDGSERSLRALATAHVLGDRFHADVHTVSVARSADETSKLRASSAAGLGVDAEDERIVVETGLDPVEVINRRRAELGSTLVVMTTRGRGRYGGAILGSVARAVVRSAVSPTVVLGPQADNPLWLPRPRSWVEPLEVPRIVAMVDGSATSEEILPIATRWAQDLDLQLTVLTVADDVLTTIGGPGPRPRFGPAHDAAGYVESLVQRWSSGGLVVDGHVQRDPIGPASGLRAHLVERPTGLVAVTTHARSGLQRARFGAQAAGIVHASVAPVLVSPLAES